MKYLVITILFFTIATSIYAQKKVVPTIFSTTPISVSQTKTLTLDISHYDANIVGEFKDKLILYKDKIETVSINEELQTLTLTYNSYMLIEDLKKTFNNYGINYQVNDPQLHISIN